MQCYVLYHPLLPKGNIKGDIIRFRTLLNLTYYNELPKPLKTHDF